MDFRDENGEDLSKIVIAETAEDAISIITEGYPNAMIHKLFCEMEVDYWKCPPSQ